MAWLIACPHHKTGIFGLIFFFFVLFYQPNLHGTTEISNFNKRVLLFLKHKYKKSTFYSSIVINLESNHYHFLTYFMFIGCALYAASFLPYGRFYNRMGGNVGMLASYLYVFVYLGFPVFRRPILLNLFYCDLVNRVHSLNRSLVA